jgi:hypothetical protein
VRSEGLMVVGGAGGGISATCNGRTVLREAGSCGGNGANSREDLVLKFGHPNQGD